MANKNILTYNSRATQVVQTYFSPISMLPTGQFYATMYTFLSKVDPWINENDPEQPTQDQRYIKNVMSNIFVAKKVYPSDISPVIPKIDWTSGTVYDYYDDTIDMFEQDENGLLVKRFYIKNKFDQVFKCLWNNKGTAATVEPIFQPGNFGTNNIFSNGGDGYKWIYLYTIGVGAKIKFMDSNWLPILPSATVPNEFAVNNLNGTTPGIGDIEVINVTNGGSGYDTANSEITINIVGDGFGATGVAQVANGVITDIIVTNPGVNYTYANVVITTANSQIGSGATAIAPSSPIGGHGFDPLSELGCSHVMITTEFNGTEDGYLSTEIDYRQIGLVIDPQSQSTLAVNNPGQPADNPADASIYKVTDTITVSPGAGTYTNDEFVYQGISPTTPTFYGTVLSFNSTTNVLELINTTGTIENNTPLTGAVSGTARTVLNSTTPDYIRYSGYVAYVENRTGVQRSPDGIEQFKFVLGY